MFFVDNQKLEIKNLSVSSLYSEVPIHLHISPSTRPLNLRVQSLRNSLTFVEPGIRHFGPFQVHFHVMLLDERLNSRSLTFIQLPFFSNTKSMGTGTFKTKILSAPLRLCYSALKPKTETVSKTSSRSVPVPFVSESMTVFFTEQKS